MKILLVFSLHEIQLNYSPSYESILNYFFIKYGTCFTFLIANKTSIFTISVKTINTNTFIIIINRPFITRTRSKNIFILKLFITFLRYYKFYLLLYNILDNYFIQSHHKLCNFYHKVNIHFHLH